MTNKEKYKQAFSVLHVSDDFSLEVKQMERTCKQRKFRTGIVTAAACVMILGSATAAYAADICGIQRTLQLWIHGEQTEVTIALDGNGSYRMNYADADGNMKYQGGGGVAVGEDGSEIPVSEEELMEELTAPDVSYEEDGSVWVYWFDQKIEITDKFENDVCYVKLVNGSKTLYMTVKYQNGYATSPHRYISAKEFN